MTMIHEPLMDEDVCDTNVCDVCISSAPPEVIAPVAIPAPMPVEPIAPIVVAGELPVEAAPKSDKRKGPRKTDDPTAPYGYKLDKDGVTLIPRGRPGRKAKPADPVA